MTKTDTDPSDARSAAAPLQPASDHDLAPLGPLIEPGLYRHYKGGRYEVLGLVRHSETLAVLVLYRALYGERGLWVRPHAMFDELVEVDGQQMARFVRIGSSQEMAP